MATPLWSKSAVRGPLIGIGVVAAAYTAYAALAWVRFGRAPKISRDQKDRLARVLPRYDVVERHHVRVSAPAEITFRAACEANLLDSSIVKAIFRGRELLLGSQPDAADRPRGLVALTRSLGWAPLVEVPGREIVMGAVTQPWQADVTFRGLPLDEFVAFNEPGYVKIAWTLRADPVGPMQSIFHTETRALATDAAARARFRRYWCLLSPGIIVIRWMMLRPVKAAAERSRLAAPAPREA
jgi:hypothetical protein